MTFKNLSKAQNVTISRPFRVSWRRLLQGLPGVAVVTVAAFYIFFAFSIRTPLVGDILGPRFFPILLGALFLILGVLYFIDCVTCSTVVESENKGRPKGRWCVALTFIFSVIYMASLDRLGYLLATTVFTFVFLTLIDYRAVRSNLIYTVLITVCFYLVFKTWLRIDLP